MTKQEYMAELAKGLEGCGEEFRREILDSIEEHFAEGEALGMAEEEIAEELGDPGEMTVELREMDAAKTEETPGGTAVSAGEALPVPERKASGKDSGTMSPVSSLVIETVMSGTDVSVTRGGELAWDYVREAQGFSLFGAAAGFLEKLFSIRAEAEIFAEEFTDSAKLTIRGGGGKLNVTVPDKVRNLRVSLVSGDFDAEALSLDTLEAVSRSGDLSVREIQAHEIRLKSTAGDIEAERLEAVAAEITCTSGDVEAQGCSAEDFHIRTMAGDIDASGCGARSFALQSTAGDIEVKSCGAVKTSLSSTAGDIRVTDDLSGRAGTGEISCEISTISGDIHYQSEDQDYTAELKMIAGDLRNRSGMEAVRSNGALHIGSGARKLRMKTKAGDITLGK